MSLFTAEMESALSNCPPRQPGRRPGFEAVADWQFDQGSLIVVSKFPAGASEAGLLHPVMGSFTTALPSSPKRK